MAQPTKPMNPNDEMYYLNGPDEFVNPNESTSSINKIFHNGKQWMAYPMPEQPDPGYETFVAENVLLKKQRERQYKRNVEQAKAAALPVLNSEIIDREPTVVFYTKDEYDWPGTMKIERYQKDLILGIKGDLKSGYILSLPSSAPESETDYQKGWNEAMERAKQAVVEEHNMGDISARSIIRRFESLKIK